MPKEQTEAGMRVHGGGLRIMTRRRKWLRKFIELNGYEEVVTKRLSHCAKCGAAIIRGSHVQEASYFDPGNTGGHCYFLRFCNACAPSGWDVPEGYWVTKAHSLKWTREWE